MSLESLLVRQSEIIKEIESIYTNFKKDSAHRKTPEYLRKRIDALDNLWGEFDINNEELEKSEDKSSEYFTKNTFQHISQYYLKTRQLITDFEASFPSASTASKGKSEEPPASTSIADKSKVSFVIPQFEIKEVNNGINILIDRQQANFRALTRLYARYTAAEMEEKWEIEDALKNIQHRWNAIDELHLQLDSTLKGEDINYNTEFQVMEHTFEKTKKSLNKKLCSTAHLRQSVPQVDIPIFSGKYTQWPTFNDLFTEAIHNNKYLSNAQKMQHLKGKLKGEAERLIQHLQISTDNYETAWEILNHRYNNPQVLFTKQVEVLLNQPIIHKQSSFELKRLFDTTTECIHAIHNLGVDTNTWDPLVVHILSKKLDADTYGDYKEARENPRELPKLNEFMTFIENKFTALEPISLKERERSTTPKSSITPKQSNERRPFNQSHNFKYHNRYQAAPISTRNFTKHTCPLCNAYHHLFQCNQFLNLPKEQMINYIKKEKICANCLYKHYDKECKSTKRCKECGRDHNTIIHEAIIHFKNNQRLAPAVSSSAATSTESSPPSETRNHSANYVATENEEVLLTTISINIKSNDNTYVTLRALLDQGSQVSLISERAAQMLGLARKYYHASISGIGPSCKQSKGMVTLECQSLYKDYHFTTQALVISHVINNLPNSSFIKQTWPHIQHVALADPEYNVSRPVDLLLDASVYSEIIMGGLIKGPACAPIAQQTKLGWILSGHVTKTFNCNVVQIEELSKYWELEDIQESSTSTTLTPEEQFCEDFYQSTTTRLEDGRYEVALPMKPNYQKHLGSSKPKATAQFLQIERKMLKDESLSEAYIKFMNEYEQLNHMRKVDSVNEPACYLPHHGVVKLDSATTVLRVVFNASSKTSSGHSLNDLMEGGPNLQQDLQSLILKWRQYKYVITADIEKMFRQIYIRKEDQALQTILWRPSCHELIKQYHLTTVTYGTKAAPFLAIRTLRQIAKDNPQEELAAAALQNSFYMDDLLGGHDSIDKVKELQRQLIEVLAGAGMNLRKWSSNEQSLTNHLPEALRSTAFDFKDSDSRKTLGLRWNPTSDTFTYQRLDFKSDSNVTKRELLSNISKVYDPLGWLSPITIRGKLLFQQTWLSDLSWDDKLPILLQTEWSNLKRDLNSIDNFEIPRYLGQINESLQLHGFCDASEKAYACAIYIVAKNNKGEYTSKLVTAKTRVTPTKKQVSLPRLELLGALLLSQLMKKVIDCISISDIKIHAWTDSMIVLGWIHGDLLKWKQFVANRVRQITEIIPAASWQHVRSEQNAADCATRGMSSEALSSHSLWWEGPKWLTTFEPPNTPPTTIVYEEPKLEAKKKHIVNAALQQNHFDSDIILELLNKYNSITRVARTIAWVSRFVARLRKQGNALGAITCSELSNAYNIIIKTVQYTEFENDLLKLKQKGHVNGSSKISSLNPFLDDKGVLRVGGRLHNSHLSYAAKHPIILSSSSRLTELIIHQAHLATLHGGPKLTLSYIRDKYWIVSGVRTVKKQLRRCVKCQRFKMENRQPIMADLPQPRVTPSRPFTNTGVDFTGYLDIKSNKGRGIRTSKGYIAVFVCLSTKAIHLELVSDLSTPAFLAAFWRMCARRGTPKHVFSDNGTNFVGANRELKREYQMILQTINTDFINNISESGITWHFNAPAWPSAGGIWESAVRSLKYHMKRVLGEQKLTYEELTTLLYQVEACLNSRPLCTVTESTDDECLTPGHFLIGGPIISRPQTDPEWVPLSTRWQMIQAMNKQIWKRWSNEYLQQLQIRSKWRKTDKNIEVGDVVIIKEDNMPPGKWAMARVCETHPGADGYIRVVSLKSKNKIIKRPVTKLTVLPVNDVTPPIEPQSNHLPQAPQAINQDQSTVRTLRPRKPIKSLFITTLFLLMSFITGSHQSFNITTIISKNSLYFDRVADLQVIKDEWNLIVYYNMTTYWKGFDQIEKHVGYLRRSCEEGTACSLIVSQFEHELNEIYHYNSILTQKQPTRSKRGLVNAIGNVASTLFGVLDDKFAEKYEKDIETLHQNEDHLLSLLKNQTTIIEAQNNIIRRNEEVMNKQFERIDQQFLTMVNEIQRSGKESLKALNAFAIMLNAMSISVLMSNLRRLQDSLINTVTDIYQGHLDTHLISPQQLQEQLNIISGQLSGELSTPVRPENIRDIYELLQVRAKVKNNYLILEVKIPLTTNANYELDLIISSPQVIDSRTFYVKPASDHVAFNLRKDTFFPITANELLSCKKYQHEKLLCELTAPIYEIKVEQSLCDIKIITNESNKTFCTIKQSECTDRWIKLHSGDSWFYSCCEECRVRVICPDGVTSQYLRGSGIITLGQDCVIKGDTFTLHGHHDYRSRLYIQPPVQEIQISPLNNIINTTLPLHLLPTENHKQEFTELDSKIKEIKTATINDISTHDIHHYSMIYITFTILCVIIIVALCYFIETRWNRSNTKIQEVKLRDPEMVLPQEIASSPVPRSRQGTCRSMEAIYSEIRKPATGLSKTQSACDVIAKSPDTPQMRKLKFDLPQL